MNRFALGSLILLATLETLFLVFATGFVSGGIYLMHATEPDRSEHIEVLK